MNNSQCIAVHAKSVTKYHATVDKNACQYEEDISSHPLLQAEQ